MFDYEVLKVIWWVLIGILLIGFAVTDGYDLGVAALVSLIGRGNTEKRIIINTVAPHWDGHQVWFITFGGAVFAAWPTVYATAFSGFYWAMLLVLFGLIGRPLAFEYRSKVEPQHRKYCDLGLLVSFLVPVLVFGVAFGNLFQGFAYSFDHSMRSSFQQSFWSLLNPFALLCGLVSLSMLLMHGATWLKLRTTGNLAEKSTKVIYISALVCLCAYVAAGIWLTHIPGYRVLAIESMNSDSNPFLKAVAYGRAGSWFDNFRNYPVTCLAPAIGCLGLISTAFLARTKRTGLGFLCSALSVAGVISSAGFALFPFIMPSSSAPNLSLTVWDATSGSLTLSIMLIGAIIFVPTILAYTIWCMVKMWSKIDAKYIEKHDHILY